MRPESRKQMSRSFFFQTLDARKIVFTDVGWPYVALGAKWGSRAGSGGGQGGGYIRKEGHEPIRLGDLDGLQGPAI